MRSMRVAVATAILCAAAACGEGNIQSNIDAAPGVDASSSFVDARPLGDAGALVPDAPRDGGAGGTPDARDGGTLPGVDAAAPVDGGGTPGIDAGGGGPPVMSLSSIMPAAAARSVTTPFTVLGFNIAAGATLRLASCDTATSYELAAAVAADGRALTATLAASPTREQGLYDVIVTNPGGASDVLACA